jgi:hypothetical protein
MNVSVDAGSDVSDLGSLEYGRHAGAGCRPIIPYYNAAHALSESRWSQQCRDQGMLVRWQRFKNGAGFIRLRPNLILNERMGRPGVMQSKPLGCMIVGFLK